MVVVVVVVAGVVVVVVVVVVLEGGCGIEVFRVEECYSVQGLG